MNEIVVSLPLDAAADQTTMRMFPRDEVRECKVVQNDPGDANTFFVGVKLKSNAAGDWLALSDFGTQGAAETAYNAILVATGAVVSAAFPADRAAVFAINAT